MLPFTAAAIQELQSDDSCRVAFRLIVNGVEHTARVAQIGTVRSSIRPLTREADIGILSVTVQNADGFYSYLNPASPFYGAPYHVYPASLYLGVWLPNGLQETYPVFTGFLSYIECIPSSRTAVLKITDIMELLRANGPSKNVGKTLHQDGVSAYEDCPAGMIKTIFGSSTLAAMPSTYVDYPSFDAATYSERAARSIVQGFTLVDGSWWDNIRQILDHSSAGLRVRPDGRIRYYTLDPNLASGAYHLKKGRNMITLRHSQNRGDIKNSVGVRRSDGTTLVGTANTPLTDTASVATYGTRAFPGGREFPYFRADEPAENAASRTLFSLSAPLTTFDAEAHIEAMQVEVGDFLLLTDADEGLNAKSVMCVDVTINPDVRRCTLALVDYEITSGLWARMDAGHNLNSTRVWW